MPPRAPTLTLPGASVRPILRDRAYLSGRIARRATVRVRRSRILNRTRRYSMHALAIVQTITTNNTPSGHGRTLYRVSVYRGVPFGGPIPVGPHKGAQYGYTQTTYHVDHYGERGYVLERPSEWHVIDYPALHVAPARWRAIAKRALPGTVTIGLDGART